MDMKMEMGYSNLKINLFMKENLLKEKLLEKDVIKIFMIQFSQVNLLMESYVELEK